MWKVVPTVGFSTSDTRPPPAPNSKLQSFTAYSNPIASHRRPSDLEGCSLKRAGRSLAEKGLGMAWDPEWDLGALDAHDERQRCSMYDSRRRNVQTAGNRARDDYDLWERLMLASSSLHQQQARYRVCNLDKQPGYQPSIAAQFVLRYLKFVA
ncbi:hypothetical protein AB1N83_012082 [Pleurotus pulmonarius]